MTQFSLSEMVCDTVQRSGCVATCSVEAVGAGLAPLGRARQTRGRPQALSSCL